MLAASLQADLSTGKAGKADKADLSASRTKYGNVRTEVDGRWFASKLEADRWRELLLLHRAGRISEPVCQPVFEIAINGTVVCRYIADFEYRDENGNTVIEDCKSTPTKTPVYRLKKRLMQACHGIEITEIGGQT